MAGGKISIEHAQRAAELYRTHGNSERVAAFASGLARSTFQGHLKAATRYGLMLDLPPAMPGMEIDRVTTHPNGGQHIRQRVEHGEVFEMPETHRLGKLTINRDAEGRVIQDWIRAEPDAAARDAAMRAV